MKLKTWIGGVGVVLFSSYIPPGFAACSVIKKDFIAQNLMMDMGGVSLTATTPIGIIQSKSFTITAKTDAVRCDQNGGYRQDDILIGQKIEKTGPLTALDGDIYSTNIQGIGIRLSRESGGIAQTSRRQSFTANKTYNLDAERFVVDIIKTSNIVGTGQLASGVFFSSYFDGDGPEKPVLQSTLNAAGISIVNASCEILGNANYVVDLGTIHPDEIGQVGQPAPAFKPIDLKVKCSGGNQKNQNVAIAFNYRADPHYAEQGVIMNTATNKSAMAAQGMAVQIFNTANLRQKEIKSGDVLNIGETVMNGETVHSLQLGARFFKVQDKVSPGDVYATANFNLVYP